MKIKPIIAEIGGGQAPQVRAPGGFGQGLYRGLQQVAGGTEEVSTAINEVERRKKQYRDLFDAAALHDHAKQGIAKYSQKWETTDQGKVIPSATKDLEGLKSSILERAKAEGMSAETVKKFEMDWINVHGEALISARRIDDRKFKEKSRSDLDSLVEMGIKEAVPMSENGRNAHFSNIDGLIDRMISDGLITGFEGEIRKRHLRTGTEARTKEIMAEIQKQEEKQKETEVYTYLKQKHGENYDEMIRELQSPALLQKFGITVEKSSNLQNILKAERVQNTEKRTEIYHQTSVNMLKLLRDDGLSKEMIDEAVSMDSLSLELGDKLKKAIDNKYEQPDGKIKTDAAVYAELFTLAHTSTDRVEVKRQILKNADKLEQSDIEKLLTKAESTYEAAENKTISRNIEFIKSQVMPKRGLMSLYLSTPEEDKDYKEAIDTFDAKIQALKKTGKEVTAEQIDKVARETAATYSKTMAERMRGMDEYSRQQLKKAKAKPQASKEEFEVGEIYEDASGNKAKYKGKGEWETIITDDDIRRHLQTKGFEASEENVRIFRKNNEIK